MQSAVVLEGGRKLGNGGEISLGVCGRCKEVRNLVILEERTVSHKHYNVKTEDKGGWQFPRRSSYRFQCG